MARDPHDEIAEVFARFKKAVEAEDAQAFEALCVEDVPPETELFLENARKLKEQGFSLRIARIEQEGEVAEVTFRVVDKAGKPVDEGELTLTQEAQGWRIRSL